MCMLVRPSDRLSDCPHRSTPMFWCSHNQRCLFIALVSAWLCFLLACLCPVYGVHCYWCFRAVSPCVRSRRYATSTGISIFSLASCVLFTW
ncbi:hypothetical protein BJX65DRAFT_281561 [Aspergillus insuetus]